MLTEVYKEMLGAKSVIRDLAGKAAERGKEIGYENVFDYSLGNPSVPVPDAINRSMIRMLNEMDSRSLHGYSPNPGIPEVRDAVAGYLSKRFGIPYKREHIFMTSAAASALAHAFRIVTSPGDEVITFAPFFPEYRPYVNLTGAVLKCVSPDTDSFQINFDEFEAMINEKTMAVLVNTPNNPSGVVYSEDTVRKLSGILEGAQKKYSHPIYIISDEPYREIVFDGKEAPCISKYYDNTIMCYSYSKSLSLPGERIGYMAVNPAAEGAGIMVDMAVQVSRGIGHNCPSSIMQRAVAENMGLTADLSVYEKNMNLIYDKLVSLGFTVVRPGGTFYIFPKALEEDSVAFCTKALKYDLVLVPGDSFMAPGYFRMAYCIDTEKVERSLPAMEEFVRKEY